MKKLSKRLLSVLLSALLVMTSLPLFAFTAMADDLGDLNDAISAYEAKMDGTVYTNMKAAYDEYIDALAAKDAYVYGEDTTVDLASAASALTTATNAMTAWAPATFNAVAYHCESTATDGYSNVVYQQNNNTVFTAEKQIESVKPKIAVPGNIVLAYDGVNEVSAPIVLETLDNRSRSQVWHYVAVSNGNFSLQDNWRGYQSGNYTVWPKDNYDGSMQQIGYDSSHIYNSSAQTNTNTSRFWWNKLIYTGTGNTTNYYETVTSFTANISCYHARSGLSSAGDFTGTTNTASVNFYVINYKPVVDGYNTMSAALSAALSGTNTIDKYSEGGLASLLTAFAKITDDTTINPNNYTYSSTASDVQTVAGKIKTATSDLSFTSPTLDGNGYSNLRAAITRSKATYDATNNNGAYTSESWSAFAAAYVAAQNIMKAQPTDEYNNDSAAATAAQTLNNAFDALETVATKVDTTPVTNLIDQFESWNNIFTASTYAAVVAAKEAASQAIWNGNYGVAGDALNDSPEAQATVETHRAAIAAAIRGLRISADAIAESSNMRMSMNQALALDVDTPSDYGNYSALSTAKSNAQIYLNQAASTDFTNYATQYAEYVSYVQAIYDAYNGLLPSFLKIPDGDAGNNSAYTNMSEVSISDQGQQFLQFGYTNSATIMKMNHEAATIPFGTADIIFSTTIENKKYNMLDSVTINASSNSTGHLTITSGLGLISSRPPSSEQLSSDQKSTYAGCLTYNDFSISNVKYTGSTNNDPDQILVTQDGTSVTDDTTAKSLDLTSLIGTLDGDVNDPMHGGIYVDSAGQRAYSNLKGDFNISVPATTAATLTANTRPSLTPYAMSGTYFGGISVFNVQNTTNFVGYNWFSTAANSETIEITVNVVDAAYLVDLITAANAILSTESQYTTSSWNEFVAALEAAQQDIDYNTLSASDVVTELQTRYDNLWREWKDATDGLQLCANNQSLKDARLYSTADKDNKTVDTIYNEGNATEYWDPTAWTAFTTAYTNVTGTNGLGNRYSDINIRNFGTSEQTTIDALAQALEDAYDALILAGTLVDPAVTAYNIFTAALADYTYTVASLNAAKTYFDGISTSFYTNDIGTRVPTANASAIAAEAAAFTNALNALATETFDNASYQSYLEAARRGVNDPDAYDVAQLTSDIATLESCALESVTIGTRTIIGLKANAQTAVDNAWSAVQSDLNTKMQYTVVVKDADGNDITSSATITPALVNGKLPYCTEVTVSAGEGSYTYDYVSNTSNTNASHKVKNIGTVSEFTFTVQGNTTITVGAPTASKPHKVTYLANLTAQEEEGTGSFVISVDYVADNTVINPTTDYTAPSYAFYSFQGFEKASYTITDDTTIILNYVSSTNLPKYSIYNADEETTDEYAFNELVQLSFEGAEAIAIASSVEDTDYYYEVIEPKTYYPFAGSNTETLVRDYDESVKYTIVAYGENFNFRARENLYIVPIYDSVEKCRRGNNILTLDDTEGEPSEVYVRTSEPNLEGTSLYTYSSFAIPEDCTFVEAGVLIHYNKQGDDLLPNRLSLSNADADHDNGNDKVRRNKATEIHTEEDNRYMIKLNLNGAVSGAKAEYVAFVNYTDGNGTLHTVYSDVRNVTIG